MLQKSRPVMQRAMSVLFSITVIRTTWVWLHLTYVTKTQGRIRINSLAGPVEVLTSICKVKVLP